MPPLWIEYRDKPAYRNTVEMKARLRRLQRKHANRADIIRLLEKELQGLDKSPTG